MSAQRTDLLPDMRSIGEFVSSYDTAGWVGLTAPANTPSEIVASTSTLMLSIMSEGGWPSMSALGQKQISGHVRVTSALPPKADIGSQPCDVRFVPKADILRCGKKCPYSMQSKNRQGARSVGPAVVARLVWSNRKQILFFAARFAPTHANASSSALASLRSAVSSPSVNQP